MGMTEDQVIVTIEAKKRLFFCENKQLLEQIEESIPCEAEVTFVDNMITDFQEK